MQTTKSRYHLLTGSFVPDAQIVGLARAGDAGAEVQHVGEAGLEPALEFSETAHSEKELRNKWRHEMENAGKYVKVNANFLTFYFYFEALCHQSEELNFGFRLSETRITSTRTSHWSLIVVVRPVCRGHDPLRPDLVHGLAELVAQDLANLLKLFLKKRLRNK
jgi:hypothetical protein